MAGKIWSILSFSIIWRFFPPALPPPAPASQSVSQSVDCSNRLFLYLWSGSCAAAVPWRWRCRRRLPGRLFSRFASSVLRRFLAISISLIAIGADGWTTCVAARPKIYIERRPENWKRKKTTTTTPRTRSLLCWRRWRCLDKFWGHCRKWTGGKILQLLRVPLPSADARLYSPAPVPVELSLEPNFLRAAYSAGVEKWIASSFSSAAE